MGNITYEVVEALAVLSASGAYEKQVNLISWNGAEPVLDIRVWNTETGKAQKGITIKQNEIEPLLDSLNKCLDMNQ